eukprot:TRINITY_DN27358_c0_g1_i1.p1 TRINITY_DN27358_c0_g1~~TRINITY_DN27358_c0_g1_i1.p1  ORF type:complete len:509 (-),score=59.84 TRINITY_DN27358_c0_g1_i1:52-1578(-)
MGIEGGTGGLDTTKAPPKDLPSFAARQDLRQPGSLTILSACSHAPRYSLGRKWGGRRSQSAAAAPGPGAYDVDAAAAKARRQRGPNFGKPGRRRSSGRMGVVTTPSPGPAAYNVSSTVGKPAAALDGQPARPPPRSSSQGRTGGSPVKSDGPGPGSYHMPSTLSSGGINMGPLLCSRSRKPPELETAPPQARLQRSSSAPTMRPTSAPAYSFGTASRPALNKGNGGESDAMPYMPPSSLRTTPAASCRAGSVPTFTSYEVRPEMGTYEVNQSTLGARSSSFSRAARPTSAPVTGKKDALGPGAYGAPIVARSESGGCAGLRSTSKRPGLHKTNDAPGPGAYQVGEHIEQNGGPCFSIPKANRPAPGDSKSASMREGGDPGPGEYGVPMLPGEKRMGEGTRGPRLPQRIDTVVARCRSAGRSRKEDGGPGPGSAPLPASPSKAVPFSQASRFPSRPKSACDVAPMSQDADKCIYGSDGVSFTKGLRPPLNEGAAEGPGPGYYKPYSSLG